MVRKINCKFFEYGGYCKNELVKRSLFGIGARCCILYFYSSRPIKCQYQKKVYIRPIGLPGCPNKPRINRS